MRRGAETDDVLLQQVNARPHTNDATCDAIAHLGFMMLPHPAYSQISFLAISTCFPNRRKISGVKTSVLMKKSRLLHASVFGRKKRTCFRTEFKNLLNIGRNVLKLEEIVW